MRKGEARSDAGRRREEARALREAGYSVTEIAQQVGRHPSWVTRLVRGVVLGAEQQERLRRKRIEGSHRGGQSTKAAFATGTLERRSAVCVQCGRRSNHDRPFTRGAGAPFCTDRCAADWAYANGPRAAGGALMTDSHTCVLPQMHEAAAEIFAAAVADQETSAR